MFFDSWGELGRVVLVGTLAYLGLVTMLRLSGNRTLAKMNAFDFVVTVALGSTLATILLSRDVALAEGLVAFGLLIGLQYAITWLSVRSSTVNGLVKAEPRLLLHRGQLLHRQMRAARVVEGEILAAVRQEGIGSLEDVDAVVLETDGAFSIVQSSGATGRSTLTGLGPQP
ncbi:MAG: hypothetical protein AVDCRST_MAG33-2258 [uncultured Thermomicrobiales bacterium]|uniref:DUF421 domain-containing protein n=1 Tax=uncultured Thermomicrobiales bacterium TaxID=1645740 RepID=A0A6J4V8A4_9BACT|nr:MAG: hypothetical protein AVDCRST_MAG33-2258 [uncultured Thermomicrobiales bacterium]